MLNLPSKRKIDQVNISTLADDMVFTLGDYIRYQKINNEILDLGIEFCEAILRGEKVKPEGVTIENIADYERYQIIKKGGHAIKEKGIELTALLQKAEEIKSTLKNLKNLITIDKETIEDVQSFFIAISTPFWLESVESFRQIKIAEGYR